MFDSSRSEPYPKTQNPKARKNDLILEEISGECLVYDSLTKKAHLLNTTLSWVWHQCDGTTTIEGLGRAFEQQFKVENGEEVVLGCLRQLETCQLLDQPAQETRYEALASAGMSRRAVITGAAIVLPAVVSIVAPTAAAAKSRVPAYTEKHDEEEHKKPKHHKRSKRVK